MILNGTHNPVETSGDVTSKTFRILASRKAFEILSSGLYSNKIRAIVRELGTNAADAHTMAGNPDPFQVTLPSLYYAYFEVKDFGTGLSNADIENLYTTYFDSNKTNSNQLTGCLGLGSKSPFSYTDSFTVESRYEGVKTSYTAYLDTHGIPAVSRMSSEPTDEPNGLTVRIPVQRDDFEEFHNECREVYQWFQTRPRIEGDFNGFEEYENLFEGDGYAIGRREKGTTYQYEPGVLVMGNVAYPLDFAKAEGLRQWARYGLVLYAEIGSVEIAASREALGYDEKTLAYLKQRGLDLKEHLPGHVTRHVEDAPTLWDARVRFWKLRQLLRDVAIPGASWQGHDITAEVKVEYLKVPGPAGSEQQVREAEVVDFYWEYGKWRGGERPRKAKTRDLTVFPPNRPVWVADHKEWRSALMGQLQPNESVYVIVSVHPNSDILARTGLDAAATRTSSTPKERHAVPPRPQTPKAVRVPVYEFRPNEDGDSGNIRACKFWKKATAPQGGVYVVIDRFVPTGAWGNPTLANLSNLFAKLGKPVTIYGVRQSDLKSLTGKWQNLETYAAAVRTKAAKTYLPLKRAHEYAARNHAAGIFRSLGHKTYTPLLKRLRKAHPLRRAVEGVLAAAKIGGKTRKGIETFDHLTRCVKGYGYDDDGANDIKLCKDCTKVLEAYPLLELLSLPTYNKDSAEGYAAAVLSYVNLIDTQNR